MFTGSSGAGRQQGGVEEGCLVVQSHAASIHHVRHSAIYAAVPLQKCKNFKRGQKFSGPFHSFVLLLIVISSYLNGLLLLSLLHS